MGDPVAGGVETNQSVDLPQRGRQMWELVTRDAEVLENLTATNFWRDRD